MKSHTFKKEYLLIPILLISLVPIFSIVRGVSGVRAANPIQHYLYVFPDHTVYVYDMDNNFQLVNQINFPSTDGGRGIIADPARGFLYLSYHGDGGVHGNGSLLKYDLINNQVVWTQNYAFGIDSGAITPDGQTIYMPDGEAAYDGTWHSINTSDGSIKGSIFTGSGNAAHNTIVGFTGQNVYLGALNTPKFFIASTSTNTISRTIGPLAGGVRPFTINGSESLVFTTHTGFLGFQVSNLNTGTILYTVPVTGFTAPAGSTSTHGISISPDEKELYLIDTPNSYVHVFDISGLPNTAPTQVANIPLVPTLGGTESPCLYDCGKEGWLSHVGDGRYVVVGDSGDVIDTTTRTIAYYLPVVNNTRKFLEIDWQNGHPIFTSSREGMGYVGVPPGTPIPTPLSPGTSTPTPTSSPTVSSTPTTIPSPSPTPGATLAQDTFGRPNQAHWGTASDGHAWGGDANTAGVFSIANNTGQVSNSTTSYSAVLGPAAANAEVLFSGSMSSYTNNNLGAVLRWSDGNNWYKAYINGTTLVVQKKVNGATTIIGSVPFTATAGTSYTLRFRVTGTTLSARVWQSASAEPAAWLISVSDTSLSSGFCGLRMLAQAGATASYTSFLATAQ